MELGEDFRRDDASGASGRDCHGRAAIRGLLTAGKGHCGALRKSQPSIGGSRENARLVKTDFKIPGGYHVEFNLLDGLGFRHRLPQRWEVGWGAGPWQLGRLGRVC